MDTKEGLRDKKPPLRSVLWWGIILVSLFSFAVIGGIQFYDSFPLSKTETETESISHETNYVQADWLYIGDNEDEHNGADGTKEIDYKVVYTLSGKQISKEKTGETVTKQPVSDTINQGTKKKLKYMWCSDGSYRYYTDQQITDGDGFTDSSPDYCASNGQGAEINVSDSLPVAQDYDTVRSGAQCNDGTYSSATGRGACSHHGGVSSWL